MPGITALATLLTIYAAGEIIARKTNAVFSSVLGMAVLLLIGFWSGILPESIFIDSGVDKIGGITAGILITSLGTTIDVEELKCQWKVVLISAAGILGAAIFFFISGFLFQMNDMAVAGIPIFAGGSVATLVMTSALKERSMETISTFCVMLYVMQKFIGVPVASFFLRKEANVLLSDPSRVAFYRNKSENEEEHANVHKRKGLLKLPHCLNNSHVFLAKLALGSVAAFYLSTLLNGIIHYYVMCLIVGFILYLTGFLEKGILQKTHSNGLITFLATIVIFTNLATTTPAQVLEVLKPLVILSLSGVVGVIIAGTAGAKILHMGTGLAISLGISCTFGFPTTMLMPKEVAHAIGKTEDERTAIENYLLPKMLIAGFVTVTILSVLLAGIAVNYL